MHFAWKTVSDLEQQLKKLGIQHFDEDLLAMKAETLQKTFGTPKSKGIQMQRYIRNVIWQLYEEIQAGQPPPFYHRKGLIRDIWYHIRKFTGRHRITQGDHESVIDNQLTRMIKARLFTYRDFNLDEANAPWRRLGLENPHIILIAEKRAFFSVLKDIQEDLGITIACLGGVPGLLTVNYTAGDMAAAGIDMDQVFIVFTMVDFDPGGLRVATHYIGHMQTSGVRHFRQFLYYKKPTLWFDLLRPEHFPKDKLKSAANEIPKHIRKYQSTIEWANNTGGVFGDKSTKWSLYANEFTDVMLRDLVERFIVPELKTPKDVLTRKRTWRELDGALTDLLMWKVLHPGQP